MNVQTDIVAHMVREKRLEGFAGHVEAQLHELFPECAFGDFVQFVEGDGGIGAAEGDAGALSG